MNESRDMPPGWKWVTVNEIALNIQYGYTESSSSDNVGPKFLRITDIQNNQVNWESVPYCAISDDAKPKYLLHDGDLVFARTGATVGKSFLIRGLVPEAVYASYLIRLRFPKETFDKYVWYFFQSPDYWNQIIDKQVGIGQPNVNGTTLGKMKIALCPLPEQHRIVAKIEELFSELDKGVEALKTAQQQLKVYRQAVLKWAFEGTLTEEWRSQQKNLPTAAQLLEQIKDEQERQAKASGKKFKPAVPLTKTELEMLPGLPKEWCWKKLSEIAERIQIGPFGSQLHQDEYQETGIPIINPKHIKGQAIHPKERILLQKTRELSQYILRTNDVILGRRGEMGRSAPIREAQNGWFCGTGSLFIRLSPCSNSKLLSLILSERRVINYLEKQSIGTTMTNLNSNILNNLPIQVIPILEQEQIVQEIESRLSVADKIEETIAQSLKQAEALRQSILKKAFEGKLVPQDPQDEPAETLLARIRAEKGAQTPENGTVKRKGPRRNTASSPSAAVRKP